MHFGKFSFGSIQIDDETYEHDVVIDRGKIHQHKKQPSKNFARTFGTRRFPGRKSYPGNTGNLLSGPGPMATCR